MVKITDVKITTEYSWNSVVRLGSWEIVQHTQHDWRTLFQTTNTGGVVRIEVEAHDPSWLDVKLEFSTWNDVKNRFTSWLDVKDFNERK